MKTCIAYEVCTRNTAVVHDELHSEWVWLIRPTDLGLDRPLELCRVQAPNGPVPQIPETVLGDYQLQHVYRHGPPNHPSGERSAYLVKRGRARDDVDIGENRSAGMDVTIVRHNHGLALLVEEHPLPA